MRCREAEERLNRLATDELAPIADPELRDHIESCPGCAADYDALLLMAKSFATASSDENDIVPMEFMRQRVEQAVPGVRTGAPALRLFGRPVRLALAVSAAAIIIIAALVPFQYQRTVGYELALNGVTRDLAENDERVCDLLYTLGLVEAAVDIGECDTTCSLTIFDLKSEQEAKLVANSIAMINDNGLHWDVIPIRTSTTGSLIDQANEKLLSRSM